MRALWQVLQNYAHGSATRDILQLPSFAESEYTTHLCAHGELGLGALGRAGLLVICKGVGVLHDRCAGLAQAQGAPADLGRRLQIQNDVRRARAVMLGQPACGLVMSHNAQASRGETLQPLLRYGLAYLSGACLLVQPA